MYRSACERPSDLTAEQLLESRVPPHSRTSPVLSALLGAGLALCVAVRTSPGQSAPTTSPLEPTDEQVVGALAEGQPAPPLSIARWLSGPPVDSLSGGRVYVVEFWASWCPASRRAVPVLTRAQQRYAGQASVVAVAGADGGEETLGAVERFVTAQQPSIGYSVGFDDRRRTLKAWMDAADQTLIPTVFIVGPTGTIAWIGNPLWPPGEFEDALGRVVAGRFGPSERAASHARWLEHRRRVGALETEVEEADSNDRPQQALQVLDALMTLNAPGIGAYTLRKFDILLHAGKDPAPAYEFGRQAVDGALKDDAEALNELAWSILEDGRPEHVNDGARAVRRDLELASKAAARAVELTAGRDGAILDTMARAYHERGDLDKAVEFQARAVEASGDVEEKTEYRRRLDEYREQRARRKDR